MAQVNQKSKWTQEQLKQACEVEAGVGDPKFGAKVYLIPTFAGSKGEGYGSEILWDKRLMKKGAFGPQEVNIDTLMGVGCSESEAESILAQVDNAMDFLKRAYPSLKVGIAEKAKALEAELKVALPAGRAEGNTEKFVV
ncbi:hypothetical protein ES703_22458 [subsurface metagenome]